VSVDAYITNQGGKGGAAAVLAIWAENDNEHGLRSQTFVCLACGTPLQEPFVRIGSLRCAECRSSNKPLDRGLVEGWRANGAHLD